MDRHVKTLSQFRDKWLANNHLGQTFIVQYNKFSPPIADFLRRHPFARIAVRYGLIPITGIAYVALYVHPGVLLLSFILLLLIGVYCSSIPAVSTQRSAIRDSEAGKSPHKYTHRRDTGAAPVKGAFGSEAT
jgi:hypothetical protein